MKTINPGALEICKNLIDDNCDGKTDNCSPLLLTNNESQIKVESRSTGMSIKNYPNPFNQSTTIQIQTDFKLDGVIKFYNSVGQWIHSRNVSLQKGTNSVLVSKEELKNTGLIYYEVVSKGRERTLLNSTMKKMMVL